MKALQDLVGQWGMQTFPEATSDTIIAHMREEVVELQEATDGYEEHGVGEELADIGLMLLHLAHRYGVDLQTEMIRKFAEVQGDEFVDDGRGYRKRVKR